MRVQPMRPGDLTAVRALFRQTVALGRPLPFTATAIDRYEALCLGWYLHPERVADHAVLVDDAGAVRGYALVCLDEPAHARAQRTAATKWALGTAGALATRRFGAHEARFHRLRLRDGLAALRHAPPAPLPAHAHVNLDGDVRGRLHVRHLVGWIDARCAAAGLPGWYGEINAPVGRRAAALTAHGGVVVARVPNRTLSWLVGRPVERLTVARPLAGAVDR